MTAGYDDLSLWHADVAASQPFEHRAPLAGDTSADVAVVGAGYTGLWTAYALKKANPDARVVVVEAEAVGFGASGRNGGWCSAALPQRTTAIERRHGRNAAIQLKQAMHDTIDEVGRVVAMEGIDCHFHKGGNVTLVRSPAQMERVRSITEGFRRFGFSPDEYRFLGPDEANSVLGATNVLGAAYTLHGASLHPLRLARGLAEVVERLGVSIVEGTRVVSVAPRKLTTTHGTITADSIVRATEAFTPALDGYRRDIAPIYSLMIATEPLPASFFASVGWNGRETFSDGRSLIIYGQRTHDDRIAFGGRGAPYHFGSAVRPEFDRNRRVHSGLQDTLVEMFPDLADAAITHRWGGAIAARRSWRASVNYDPATGLGWAGGYVGNGVAAANLAGRTLADLISGTSSDLTALCWVNEPSRRWEPEPLRWIGINAMVRFPIAADRYETRTGRPERWRTGIVAKITGH